MADLSWWVTYQCPVCDEVESRRLEAPPSAPRELELKYEMAREHKAAGHRRG